jgi:hypothetical protein
MRSGKMGDPMAMVRGPAADLAITRRFLTEDLGLRNIFGPTQKEIFLTINNHCENNMSKRLLRHKFFAPLLPVPFTDPFLCLKL